MIVLKDLQTLVVITLQVSWKETIKKNKEIEPTRWLQSAKWISLKDISISKAKQIRSNTGKVV